MTWFQCWYANNWHLTSQREQVFREAQLQSLLSLRWGSWHILWKNCGVELQRWENAASSHFPALLEKMKLIKLTPDQSLWQNVSGGLTQFSFQQVHYYTHEGKPHQQTITQTQCCRPKNPRSHYHGHKTTLSLFYVRSLNDCKKQKCCQKSHAFIHVLNFECIVSY